jgi:hypothetical protein
MCDASGKTTSDEWVISECIRRAISTGVAGYFLNALVQVEAAHGLTDPMDAVNTECLEKLERVSKRHLLNAERAAIEAFEKQLTIF